MEIIIRTESTESAAQPPSVQTYAQPAVAPAPSAVDQARPTDAINAGPAPTSPGQTGGPPVHVVASEYLHAESDSAQSAGAAPDIS
jgi:hypothetical protein